MVDVRRSVLAALRSVGAFSRVKDDPVFTFPMSFLNVVVVIVVAAAACRKSLKCMRIYVRQKYVCSRLVGCALFDRSRVCESIRPLNHARAKMLLLLQQTAVAAVEEEA